jgi:hypothetical protein
MSYTVRYLQMEYPVLGSEHTASAALFANRHSLLVGLPVRKDSRVAEVGVAMGEFSEFIIEKLRPLEFVAIDTFALDKSAVVCGAGGGVEGKPTAMVFGGKSHVDFVRDRLSGHGSQLNIQKGRSTDCLRRFEDHYFDLIYLDADHSYDAVKADAEVAARKVKTDGILMFNDYIMFDHIAHIPYGVVPVVNDLIVNGGWTLVGFALQSHMFCDVALMREPVDLKRISR